MKFNLLKRKNNLDKTKEKSCGRSMVEMLGVLAIIGVLSIGGIQGYTLAMRRFRANEIASYLNKVAVIAYSQFQSRLMIDPDFAEIEDNSYHEISPYIKQMYKCKGEWGYGSYYCFEDADYSKATAGLGAPPQGIERIYVGGVYITQDDKIAVSIRGNMYDKELCNAMASVIPEDLNSYRSDSHPRCAWGDVQFAFIVD